MGESECHRGPADQADWLQGMGICGYQQGRCWLVGWFLRGNGHGLATILTSTHLQLDQVELRHSNTGELGCPILGCGRWVSGGMAKLKHHVRVHQHTYITKRATKAELAPRLAKQQAQTPLQAALLASQLPVVREPLPHDDDDIPLVGDDEELAFDDGNAGMRCVDGMLFRVSTSDE